MMISSAEKKQCFYDRKVALFLGLTSWSGDLAYNLVNLRLLVDSFQIVTVSTNVVFCLARRGSCYCQRQ